MKRIVLIHGDVTFKEATEIPKTAKLVKAKKGFVVEKGEGVHAHILENECDIYIDTDGTMYFKTNELKVNHEEHGLQTAISDTGIIVKEIEREFDYEDMEARRTLD